MSRTLNIRIVALTILSLAISLPSLAGAIYTNGAPVVGNSFVIGGIYSISDGFVATVSGTATSFDFGFADPTGATPLGVSWELGTTPFASDIASGSVAALSYVYVGTLLGAEDIFDATVTGLNSKLTAGNTYYLSLGNATDTLGFTVDGWQISNGPATCFGAKNGVLQGPCAVFAGTNSEAFIISGVTTPEPGTMTLLGSGLLVMAGLLRRRIGR